MNVSQLPLSPTVKKLLESEGYEKLYPPQEDAIKAGVLDGKNVVLASPTASGKTLIAELCILKSVLAGGKALYLTPLRALAREKFDDFQKYKVLRKESGEKIRLTLTTGEYDSADSWVERYDIVISTNEKLDSLLRHKANWISELTVVVSDEVHLLTEAGRGPTLEVVLTRIRQVAPKAQILALSATVRNADEIARWLDATAITTEWRPVPLREGVHYDELISFKDGSTKTCPAITGNPILDVALNVVQEGAQALIFAETRRSAVEIGKKSSAVLRRRLTPEEARRLKIVARKSLSDGEQVRINQMLATQIEAGAGFHHAGLGPAQRKTVEDLFRKGVIKILAATPTLAAGVNLPARTVVISSYERYESGFGRYPISVLDYKQFSGRAGRPRYDKFGESVLLAKTEDEREYLMENYVFSKPENLWSKLAAERVLRPHVLSTIATGFAHSEAGLYEFFSKTLYAQQYGPRMIRSKIGDILRFLCVEGMVEFQEDRLLPTIFGKRISELYIDPLSAVLIRNGLNHRATKMTNLSFLHLIAHTPDASPRMYPRRNEMENLEALTQKHSDEFMFDSPNPWEDQLAYDEFMAELKYAYVLLDWIREKSEEEIFEAHRVEPGDLLRVVEIADWLLYSSHELARLLGHTDLLKPVNVLRARVENGVKSELLELVRLKGIGRVRARMLANNGFKTIPELSRGSITRLTQIPLIGPKLAKSIKEQVGGKISSEEWKTLNKPGQTIKEQKLLTEYKG